MGCYPDVRNLIMTLSADTPETHNHNTNKYNKTSKKNNNQTKTTQTTEKSVDKMIIAGFVSGALGYLFCSPFYQVKTQMQAEAGLICKEKGVFLTGRRVGHQPTYKNVWHALSVIGNKAGIRGLWRGSTALVVRGALLTAGQQTGYDFSKTYAKNHGVVDGPILHIGQSLLAYIWLNIPWSFSHYNFLIVTVLLVTVIT